MSYTVELSFNPGKSRAGLGTVAWSLDKGTTWSTAGVAEAPAGSGLYARTFSFADGFAGTVTWTTGDGNPRYGREDVYDRRVDLTQPLADVATATVGGALHGGWALAFGRQVLDRANKLLQLFGFNSQTVPLKTHGLDDGVAPSTRTPQ